MKDDEYIKDFEPESIYMGISTFLLGALFTLPIESEIFSGTIPFPLRKIVSLCWNLALASLTEFDKKMRVSLLMPEVFDFGRKLSR